MATRGICVHVHTCITLLYMVEFQGHPKNVSFIKCNFLKILIQTKRFTGLLQLIQLYLNKTH